MPAPPAIEWAATSTFVGRGRELDRLDQLWRAAGHGPPQLVVIVGEPGIGKTCLAAQAALGAHAEGATVLFGRCEEEALRPYQPFAEAFEHYVRSCLLESDEPQLERIASEFAPLLPEIRDLLPEEPVADAGAWERPRLFENVASFLARLSGVAPVMVVLDDLQWADTSTLLLLRHLLGRPHPSAVLIVATLRPTEASGRAVLNELADLRRHHVVQRLHLGGLEEDQVRELLDAGTVPLSDDHQRAWARDLRAWTEGNPLFIEELVRHLRESGLMDHARAPRLEDFVLPDDISEVIGRRLSRLSPAATHSLLVAAVLGRNFRVDVVEAVAELGENDLLGALEEGAAAGIIAEDPDTVGSYGFSHALVRDALYRRLSTLRRARLHRRIGEALEALHEDHREAHVAELAYHFCRASPSDARAPTYATQAGDQAMAQLAYEEAAELYLAALDAEGHLASEAADDLQSSLFLQIRAVLALARAGATDRAQEQLEKFGFASRDLDEVPPGVAEDVAALRARLTKDRALASQGPEREALARDSADLYEAIFVRLKRPYACVNAATMWLLAGDDTRAAGLAASALQLARETAPASPAEAYWLAATEAEAALLLGDSSGAAEALRRAVVQPAADLAARMVTRRQLEIVCATKGVDTDVLSPLGVPGATAAPA